MSTEDSSDGGWSGLGEWVSEWKVEGGWREGWGLVGHWHAFNTACIAAAHTRQPNKQAAADRTRPRTCCCWFSPTKRCRLASSCCSSAGGSSSPVEWWRANRDSTLGSAAKCSKVWEGTSTMSAAPRVPAGKAAAALFSLFSFVFKNRVVHTDRPAAAGAAAAARQAAAAGAVAASRQAAAAQQQKQQQHSSRNSSREQQQLQSLRQSAPASLTYQVMQLCAAASTSQPA